MATPVKNLILGLREGSRPLAAGCKPLLPRILDLDEDNPLCLTIGGEPHEIRYSLCDSGERWLAEGCRTNWSRDAMAWRCTIECVVTWN